jgi:alpha-D-ribose 1-methylphosphonate 5-phosphate C-P lyase
LVRGDDGDLYQLDGTNTDSVRGWLGGVVYRNVAASAAHTNTTTEALFDRQFEIPANTLKAGSVIKVRFQGIATATNSTDTLTIKLYLGGLSGTAILTGTATDVANNDIFCGEATIVIRTAGASGTFVAFGSHSEVPAASGTATPVYEITASTVIDTTAAQVVGVGADWSVANAGNSCRLDILVVEIN